MTTGGTARVIADAGVPVTPVEQVTGFPESLDGRVKTLHPRVHAGLLADMRNPAHVGQLDSLGIEPYDLLVVNLYPFEQTVASGAGADECVEQIDIGGPAMVRAAAKNHASVAVVVDPHRYGWVLDQVRDGGFTLADRRSLAVAALPAHGVLRHRGGVVDGLGAGARGGADLPGWVGASWERQQVLRYGENPHQRAALYVSSHGGRGLATAEQLHGKEMSYNNYVDADAAWRAAYDHELPSVAIIKHTNPCGIAVSIVEDIADAHRRAHDCDPLSAFGGVIAANREVTVEMAEQVAEVFTEVIVAPSFADGALDVLARKKNIRILAAAAPPGRARRSVRSPAAC